VSKTNVMFKCLAICASQKPLYSGQCIHGLC